MGGAQPVDSALNSIATARLDILKEPVAPAFGVATSRTVSARDLDNMNKASSCKPAVSIKALYSFDQSTFTLPTSFELYSNRALHLSIFTCLHAALWRLLALKLNEGNIRFRIACFGSAQTQRCLLTQSTLGVRELSGESFAKNRLHTSLLSVASCSVPLFRTLSPWTASSSSAKKQAPRKDDDDLLLQQTSDC